jgi:hypothetical protein
VVILRTLTLAACVTWLASLSMLLMPSSAPAQPASPQATYTLEEFGPLGNADQAQATLDAALTKIAQQGGGVLFIPAHAPADWKPTNHTQEQLRTPAPPAPTKSWKAGPGVTVVDLRGGTMSLTPPQSTGLNLSRSLKLPLNQSLPHWDYFPMITLENAIARGGTSYREPLIDAVEVGADRRFYVATVRGLFPGMFLNAGDADAVRLAVKTLGYDAQRNLWYFTADTTAAIAARTLLHNKNHVNLVRSQTQSHNENQTFDVFVQRFNYSQGDNYLIDARLKYMSDLHSTGGDENNVLFSAFVYSLTHIFRGKVESFDRDKGELVYAGGAQNPGTLGSGRPIINMNPAKQIASGKAWVTLPSGAILGWGASVQSTDPAWTPEVVGRFFAIDEPSEMVPGGDRVRRWFLISQFKEENGVKMLSITRHWWGAKHGSGISQLYDPRNFTTSISKPKLLSYIIAPGAYPWDVADGVESPQVNPNGSKRTLRLSPGPANGTPFDFEPGDPIEQAIGSDPFRPVPFRSWVFENVPGVFPAAMFDIANYGDVRRDSVLRVSGGPRVFARPADDQPWRNQAWQSIFAFEAACETGIHFVGDTRDAAIRFNQPTVKHGGPQRIDWWVYFPDKPGHGSVLLWLDDQGVFQLTSRWPLSLQGQSIMQVTGIAPNPKEKSANLRGRAVPVPAGATDVKIAFAQPEVDKTYTVVLRGNWIANLAVSKQDTTGFTVLFDRPAPENATLHWMLTQ